jgi:hypothetical protein
MTRDWIEPLPRVNYPPLRPGGIRINAPTPRLGRIPNPWKPKPRKADWNEIDDPAGLADEDSES